MAITNNSQNARGNPKDARSEAFPAWAKAFLALTLLVLVFAFFKAMTAPKEATMGNLYRIFFYHFPHAILSFVFPYLNCVASFAYLYWRNRNPAKALKADAFALASAEVTVLYASAGLATGMLWGRAAWGIWWTWDARLTTYLLLWLLYVSYLLVRRLSATGQTAVVSAVLAIFAAIDIPICFMSIRWWRTQHPSPVFGDGGSIDPRMLTAVLWNVAGWALWGAFILGLRYAIERRRQRQATAHALSFMTAPETAPIPAAMGQPLESR